MNDFPQRKHPRLKTYDYSLPGYYYITIHCEKGQPSLSVVRETETEVFLELTRLGRLVERQLLALEQRFFTVKIDKYVLMPNHLHVILMIKEANGAALPAVIGAFKSLATKEKNTVCGTPGIRFFQQSFYETVLRNEQAYQEAWLYIDQNPAKWAYMYPARRG